jgi:hypothetical protein
VTYIVKADFSKPKVIDQVIVLNCIIGKLKSAWFSRMYRSRLTRYILLYIPKKTR